MLLVFDLTVEASKLYFGRGGSGREGGGPGHGGSCDGRWAGILIVRKNERPG